MYSYEIWQKVSEELGRDILDSAYTHNKKLYRRTIEDISANMRQRVQRLLDMKRKERHVLFKTMLGLIQLDLLGQNLLLDWLLNSESKMLAAFLDKLDIPHDGNGKVDEFPEKADSQKLKVAVEHLYASFPQEKVTVYLNAFDTCSGANWDNLKVLIKSF